MNQRGMRVAGLLLTVLLTSGGFEGPSGQRGALGNEGKEQTCVVDIPQLVGQPYVVGEQHRGLYRTLPQGAAADLTTPRDVGKNLGRRFQLSSRTVRENVALLIVDNFNQRWTPEHKPTINHGNLVLWHVDQVLQGAGYGRTGGPPVGEGTWTYKYANQKTLTVYTLTTATGSSSPRPLLPLADKIGRALDKITQSADRVVVNMSFGLMSCGLLRDIQQYQGDLDKFRQQFPTADSDRQVYLRRVFTPPRSPGVDRLRQVFERGNGSGPRPRYALFFAAAGNYGLDFPLYPAQWPEVVAVGALTPRGRAACAVRESKAPPPDGAATRQECSGGLENWSNRGDVAAAGQWFRQDGPQVGNKPLYYLGTSFAAPNLAVATALELAVFQTPKCSRGGYRSVLQDPDGDPNTWKNEYYEQVFTRTRCLN